MVLLYYCLAGVPVAYFEGRGAAAPVFDLSSVNTTAQTPIQQWIFRLTFTLDILFVQNNNHSECSDFRLLRLQGNCGNLKQL